MADGPDRLPALPTAAAAPPARPVLDLYDVHLEGRPATTRRAYEAAYRDFARFVAAPGPREALAGFVRLSHGEANLVGLKWVADLTERGLAPATIAARIWALRSYVDTARKTARVEWSLDVDAPRVVRLKDTRGPGAEGWGRLLAYCRRRPDRPLYRRDLAMLLLLHDVGLRRAEVLALDYPGGVDLPGLRVRIVGKGHREPVPFTVNETVAWSLASWIEARGTGPGPLFVRLDRAAANVRGGRLAGAVREEDRLTGHNLARRVAALGRAAGLAGRLRPHGLRHEAITRALDLTNGDVRAVQKFSRHADVKMVQRYDDNRRDEAGRIGRLLGADGWEQSAAGEPDAGDGGTARVDGRRGTPP